MRPFLHVSFTHTRMSTFPLRFVPDRVSFVFVQSFRAKAGIVQSGSDALELTPTTTTTGLDAPDDSHRRSKRDANMLDPALKESEFFVKYTMVNNPTRLFTSKTVN